MTRKLVIISGARGAGKGTLVSAIEKAFPQMRKMVAHTTRPKRVEEVDGRSYNFVNEQELGRLADKGKFFWTVQIGPTQWSGLSIEEVLKTEMGVIDVYPEGALNLREWGKKNGDAFFLLAVFAPNWQRLQRIRDRPGTSAAEAYRLYSEDPVSPYRQDYLAFDHWIDNSRDGKPECACEQAISAVQDFLNGSTA